MSDKFTSDRFQLTYLAPYLLYTQAHYEPYLTRQCNYYLQLLDQHYPLYFITDCLFQRYFHKNRTLYEIITKLRYTYHILPYIPSSTTWTPPHIDSWTEPVLVQKYSQFLVTQPTDMSWALAELTTMARNPPYPSKYISERTLANLQINKLNPNIPEHLKHETYFRPKTP